jgi:xanthine dehydrogenase accessory factor
MADVAERRAGLVIAKPLAAGAARIVALDQPDLPRDIRQRAVSGRSGLVATPEGEVFVHALQPPARIVAIGATHISQVLAGLARLAGYEIHVVDPRTAFATPARFAGVTLHAEWPEAALARIGLDPYTAVAVLAHVDHIDDEALKLALKSDARYIGALGSKRTHGRRIERLSAAGLSSAEIARIKNPIGLDIGAVTPEEIALSVMAEIIAAVRVQQST